MSGSNLWLVNEDGKVFTFCIKRQQLCEVHRPPTLRFKKVAAINWCTWAIASDHLIYLFVHYSEVPIRVQECVYENERWLPGSGWSGNNLFSTERTTWSDINGISKIVPFHMELPSENWDWEDTWHLDENLMGDATDVGGWQYGMNFSSSFSSANHWNSYVRRRRWVRFRTYIAMNRWIKLKSLNEEEIKERFVDISVGGYEAAVPKYHFWAVTISGKIYIRLDVSYDNPEGSGWLCVSTPNVDGICSVSAGPTDLVWAVTWAGNCLVRTGLSDSAFGNDWVLVNAPNNDNALDQVSTGSHSVWALTRHGHVWFRKGIMSDVSLSEYHQVRGTQWIEMVGEMATLSVGLNNMVFAIGLHDGLMYFRGGVTQNSLTGQEWQAVFMTDKLFYYSHSDNSLLLLSENSDDNANDNYINSSRGDIVSETKIDGLNSQETDSFREEITFDYNTSLKTLDTRIVYRNLATNDKNKSVCGVKRVLNRRKRNALVSDTRLPIVYEKPTGNEEGLDLSTEAVHDGNISYLSPQFRNLNLSPESTNAGCSTKRHGWHESVGYNYNDQLMKSNDKSSDMCDGGIIANDCDIYSDKDVSYDCDNCPDKNVIHDCDNYSEKTNEALGEHKFKNLSSSLQLNFSQNNSIDASADFVNGKSNDKTISQQVSFNHLNFSNDKLPPVAKNSESILNFVTDLLDDTDIGNTTADSPLISINNSGCREKSSLKHVYLAKSKVSEENTVISPAKRLYYQSINPETLFQRMVTVKSSPDTYITPVTKKEAKSCNYNWLWISSKSCDVDEVKVKMWMKILTARNRVDFTAHIDQSLRDVILQRLRERNKQESSPFCHLSDRDDKTIWVKRAALKMKVSGSNKWKVLPCTIELEQNVDGNTASDSMVGIHYKEKDLEKHIQIPVADISCVCRSLDVRCADSLFAIFTKSGEGRPSVYLTSESEKEVEDWIGSIIYSSLELLVNKEYIQSQAIWSTTTFGQILIYQPENDYWNHMGGALRMLETCTLGITWGLGDDNTVWVYTGGHGGGPYKAYIGESHDVAVQSDVREMSVYENQKWHLLTGGYCNRNILTKKYLWTDETGYTPLNWETITPPTSSWKWISDWSVDLNCPGGVDKEGWQYAYNFGRDDFHGQKGWGDNVRRRKWIRKCKVVTNGPWRQVGSIPLQDISLYVDDTNNHVALWAVAGNGDVLCRLGVTRTTVQGVCWQRVPADQPFCAISVGGHFWVWVVAKDGSIWFRSGVTAANPIGTGWFHVVNIPPGGAKIKQISVGANTVWAVDSKYNLWFRKDISVTFPEGTEWLFVCSHIVQISAGANDQVWAIADMDCNKYGALSGVVCKRLCVTPDNPMGTRWKTVIGGGWRHVTIRGLPYS